MRRKLLTLVSALSLVLCAATLVLWPLSYTSWFDIHYFGATGPLRSCGGGVSSAEGLVFLEFLKHDRSGPDSSNEGGFYIGTSSGNQRLWSWSMSSLAEMGRFGHQWHGFGVLHKGGIPVEGETETVWALMLPHWFAAIVLMLLPSNWAVVKIRKFRRLVSGRCPKCGYDLRASTERCPECGEPITSEVRA